MQKKANPDIKLLLEKLSGLINKVLDKFLPEAGYPKILYKAMRYSLLAGGKRLRPALCLLSAKACGLTYNDAMPFAAAIEMIHTYSLIHDDLPAMDNDDFRRGMPTSHKKFSEAVAILAGDALLTKAFELMMSCANNKKIKKENIIIAACKVAKASGSEGMIGGQIVDIESEKKKVSKQTLKYLHEHKTGALITASIMAGVMLAGADKRISGLFRQFGEKIGLAFQIADDILDVAGDEKKLGKKAGKDAKAGKATYPGLYGLEESRRIAEKLVDDAIEILTKIKKKTGELSQVAKFIISRAY